MKQVLTVRAIIKKDQKVLLLRRSGGDPSHSGLFELPGGKVGYGEDPKAALQREVLEETGQEIDTLQLFDVYSIMDTHEVEKQYIILTFLATLKPNGRISLSTEHDKFVWDTLSNVQLNTITDMTRTILQIEDVDSLKDEYNVNNQYNDVNKTSGLSELIIYADGGSRGNPGPSSSGFVIKDKQEQLLFEGGKYLGVTTNNQAEYHAVRLALEKALEFGAKRLQVRLDSQLVVNQMNGVYQIRNRELWPVHAHIKELIKKFDKVTFVHVRREFNKEADAMVNKILDAHHKA